jgi:putative aldouronate transport system substrate-binding protein
VKKTRWLAALLAALCLALPALAEEPVTMTMMGLEEDSSGRSWQESLFFQRMEAQTGVRFTFDQYSDAAAYQQAKEAAFAGDNLPDVLFKANLTREEEMAWAQSGQLIDLAPLLAEYAPNLSAILAQRPDWLAIIAQPDGVIASLPSLSGAERQCALWINQSWLAALELPMPTTIEAYTETLRAFRDGDPNGNGAADEIPLSLVGPFEAKFLLHAWGLTPNDYNIYVDEAGAVRFAPLEAGYRDFVAWLKMALDEQLIDENAFRMMQSARNAAFDTQTDADAPKTIGGMISIAPYTVVDMADSTLYQVVAPLAFEGKQVYRRLLTGVGTGAFAITSACEDPGAALRWVDTLYTEAGGRLAFAGLEGEDYTLNPDGSWVWTSDEDYTRLSDISIYSIIAGDAKTPGLEPAAFLRNTQIQDDNHSRRQTDTLREYLVQPFPVTWPTDAARAARIAELQAALGTCVDTAIANFAMGLVELNDENWAAFEAELRALGVEEFVGLWQQSYNENQ